MKVRRTYLSTPSVTVAQQSVWHLMQVWQLGVWGLQLSELMTVSPPGALTQLS